ncbi:MAG: DegT/DnrJ/EryC1/StrS family aminotransferase [Lachnospiraceae bacterium]|nr:DegT/DnrJ/EryC1/StrS family aminotransferase [Lachnospiraceae bacterium]
MKEKIFVTRSSMPPYEEFAEAIRPLWDSRWLTNMGCYHKELEEKLKDFLKVPGLSLFVNGHMSLELAIQAFQFAPGSEVITTPFTFISTTHAIVRNNLKPVFCDIKWSDGTMDESKIEDLITEHTAAIVPVHVYGNLCRMEAIQEIADHYGLAVIYDAAHAFGIEYQGRGIGSFGDASVFSFHATKVFHTIEGGAVAFTDPKLYDRLYTLKNFGIQGEELVTGIGANAKMNEFSAIMGLCNLKYISRSMEGRKKSYEFYKEQLEHVKGLRLFRKEDNAANNYAYFPILVEEEYGRTRDELWSNLREEGIYARKYFYPLTSDQACFKNKYRNADLQQAREISKRALTLPLYEDLELESQERIIDILKNRKGRIYVSMGEKRAGVLPAGL